MVEKKSVKSSSENTTAVEITSQALASSPLARNLKVCGKKGTVPSPQSNGDLAEDLSDISDAEVAGCLNKKKEFLLMKIAWEMMNPEYQKGKQRKPTTGKKKGPINKTGARKKTSTTRNESDAASENEKRLSSDINADVLDKLFDANPKLKRYQLPDENSPKRAKSEKPVIVGDQVEHPQQSSEECLLEPQEFEEEEPDWNEDYSYGGAKELNGDEDHESEDQDEGEDNEEIIW